MLVEGKNMSSILDTIYWILILFEICNFEKDPIDRI